MRLNIEESAHRRVAKLADFMRCSKREALGTVSYLWTESQEILKTHGTREQIIEWAYLFDETDERIELWIQNLIRARIISKIDATCSKTNSELFEVHGNEIQIESRVGNIARAAKGGQALKKKWNAKKKLEAGLKKASSKPQAGAKPPIQCNTSQPNAQQSNAIQGKDLGVLVPAEPTPRDLIALYCDLWREKYKSDRSPDIRGKTAGLFKGLVKDLGYARAEVLVHAYLQMDDSWFITKTHDFETLLANLPKVSLFADSGKMITKSQLKNFEKQQASRELDKLIEEGKI